MESSVLPPSVRAACVIFKGRDHCFFWILTFNTIINAYCVKIKKNADLFVTDYELAVLAKILGVSMEWLTENEQ